MQYDIRSPRRRPLARQRGLTLCIGGLLATFCGIGPARALDVWDAKQPLLCSPDRWCWLAPRPTGDMIHGLSADGALWVAAGRHLP